jgi:hypothetical protein
MRKHGSELGRPSHAARAYAWPLAHRVVHRTEAASVTSCRKQQRVAWILSFEGGGNHQAIGQVSRQILAAVHRKIDSSIEQCVFDFLDEHALHVQGAGGVWGA